jgi:hypothetical protein
VTTHQRITIAEWSESQNPVITEKRAPRRFWPPGVIGLAGTLLLHGLALQTVVLGSRAQKIRPPEVLEPGSSLNRPAPKPADALVFIDLPKTGKTTDETYEALASVRAAIKDSPIPVTHPDPAPLAEVQILALSEDRDPESSVDSGDGAERARLFGIYSRQIQARVERMWRRPRTPVQEGTDSGRTADSVDYFQCQVQIVQDSSGNVQEILLPNCNGSVAWQRSLVLAIQHSSPLSAPPSPTVFSHTLTIVFTGDAYTSARSADDYELDPSPSVHAQTNGRDVPPQPSFLQDSMLGPKDESLRKQPGTGTGVTTSRIPEQR